MGSVNGAEEMGDVKTEGLRMAGTIEAKKPTYKMQSRLTSTIDKDAMLHALKFSGGFDIDEDADAGTVVVRTKKSKKEVFRGIAKNRRIWLVRYPVDLFFAKGRS